MNKVTIVVPTKDRVLFLKNCLDSISIQTYQDYQLIVIDNCSKEWKLNKKLVASYGDKRFKYIKNKKDLGIIGNWNKAISICKTEYLSIFHDDDIMLPNFIKKSVFALEKNPTAMMSYTKANKVDQNLNFISLWSSLYPNNGLIKSPNYLFYTIEQCCCITIAPTVLYRKKVFNYIGKFDDKICFNTFDFNLMLRIAEKYDIFFINEVLVKYRIHKNQMSQTYWWSGQKIKGRIATLMEIQNAISYLLNNDMFLNKEKKKILSHKLSEYTKMLSVYLKKILPDL